MAVSATQNFGQCIIVETGCHGDIQPALIITQLSEHRKLISGFTFVMLSILSLLIMTIQP